jgi:hypothetical protein
MSGRNSDAEDANAGYGSGHKSGRRRLHGGRGIEGRGGRGVGKGNNGFEGRGAYLYRTPYHKLSLGARAYQDRMTNHAAKESVSDRMFHHDTHQEIDPESEFGYCAPICMNCRQGMFKDHICRLNDDSDTIMSDRDIICPGAPSQAYQDRMTSSYHAAKESVSDRMIHHDTHQEIDRESEFGYCAPICMNCRQGMFKDHICSLNDDSDNIIICRECKPISVKISTSAQQACGVCKLEGHNILTCPDNSFCSGCKQRGHIFRYCRLKCALCKKKGHLADDCDRLQIICSGCNERGHSIRQCKIQCTVCRRKGHTSNSCQTKCTNCHQIGHLTKSCTQPVNSRKGALRKFMPIEQEWSVSCDKCQCMHLASDAKVFLRKCCLDGKDLQFSDYPNLEPLDEVIVAAITADVSGNFSRNSSSYNNMLAFGATGVENESGGGWRKVKGNHSVTMNGRTYHYLTKASSSDPSGALSYFTFDMPENLQSHCASINSGMSSLKHRMDENLLLQLFCRLKEINPIAQELCGIGAAADSVNLDDDNELYQRLNVSAQYLEVAQITNINERCNRVITVRLRGGGGSTIPLSSNVMEPISYPLLFNYGELGWGEDTKDIVSFTDYIASRLLRPDLLRDGSVLMLPSKADPQVLLPTNRFQAMARLGNVYLVDMCSRGTLPPFFYFSFNNDLH